MKFPGSGLYVITQTENKTSDTIAQEVEAALRGGAKAVQYRDKQPRDALTLATRLTAICEHYGVPLIVNDDVQLALSAGAHGVHLGKDDDSVAQARAVLGEESIVGVSCYDSVQRAIDAEAQGASYVAFGRFYASQSKPLAEAAHLQTLTRAKSLLCIPIVAIGGILPENGAALLLAGADVLAVIGGVFDSDAEQSARRFQTVFQHCQEKRSG